MSLIRDPVIITAVGHQMMTAGGDITYTKATLYGQDISHLTKDQLESLTSIGNPLLTVPVGISDKSDNDNATTVVIEATFQNANLKADLPYTAVGFFAKRGDDAEKLVLIGVANPGAYLVATPPDGVATDALDIKVAIAIGDATSVTAVVDPAGSVTPATLNGAINKLDHDLTARIDVKADKTTVESVLATKANQSDLDKTNAEVAKKANSEDVTSQLATKANSSDVAASVKSLTDSIATKADAKTVNDAISKIDFTPYAKTADVDSKLQSYTNTADLTKLLDAKANAVDVYSKTELDKKLLALSTDTDGKVNVDQVSSMIANKVDKSDLASDLKAVNDSIATKANSSDVNTALAKKDDTTDVDAKIKTVTDLASTKADASDTYNKKAVDDAFSQRDNSINNLQGELDKQVNANWAIDNVNGQFNAVKTGYNVSDRSTQSFTTPGLNLLNSRATEIDQLKGRRTVNQPDFNALTDGGSYYITDPSNGKNSPTGSWGNLFVSNGNGHRISQLYFPDDGSALFMRELDESTWHGWLQLATIDQVNNALNVANQANSALAAKANVTDVTKAQSTADSANANANGRLSVAGGNMNTTSVIQWNGGGIDDKNGNLGGITWNGGTDWAKIYGDQDGDDNLDLAFDLGDDGSNHFSFRQNGSETSAITSDGHYTGTVDWGHVNGRPQDQVDRVNIITPLFRQIQNSNNWNDIFGVGNPNNVLTSLRIDSGGSGSLLNNFAAGIGFGGADTKGVLSVAYNDHQARITGGNGTSPVWSEDIAWKSDVNDLRNQVQQLRENQFEVQTFTDATAAANWEAQRPGKRMAIIQS